MVGDRFKIKNKCTVCIQEVYISINYLSQLRSSSFNTPIYKHDLSGIFTFLSVKGKDRSFCQIICQHVMHRNLQTRDCFLPIFHFMHIIHITVITYMTWAKRHIFDKVKSLLITPTQPMHKKLVQLPRQNTIICHCQQLLYLWPLVNTLYSIFILFHNFLFNQKNMFYKR